MRMSRLFLSLILLTTTCFGQNLKPVRGMPFVNRGHKLGSGLEAGWLFNEGSGGQVFDLSGNGADGAFTGDAAWGAGKFGNSVEFTQGGTGYITWLDNPILHTNYQSIVVWMKLSAVTSFATIAGCGNALNDGLSIAVRDDVTPLDIAANASTSVGKQMAISLETMSMDEWHQLAATYDGVNVKLYMDGLERASTPNTGTLEYDDGEDFLLGGDKERSRWNTGAASHFYVYNRGLSASEIALLYREPFCMFKRNLQEESMYSVAAPSVIPTPYYYQATFSVPFLTLLVLSIYCCLRRRKCAA